MTSVSLNGRVGVGLIVGALIPFAGFFVIQSFWTQNPKKLRNRSSVFACVRGAPFHVPRKAIACAFVNSRMSPIRLSSTKSLSRLASYLAMVLWLRFRAMPSATNASIANSTVTASSCFCGSAPRSISRLSSSARSHDRVLSDLRMYFDSTTPSAQTVHEHRR